MCAKNGAVVAKGLLTTGLEFSVVLITARNDGPRRISFDDAQFDQKKHQQRSLGVCRLEGGCRESPTGAAVARSRR